MFWRGVQRLIFEGADLSIGSDGQTDLAVDMDFTLYGSSDWGFSASIIVLIFTQHDPRRKMQGVLISGSACADANILSSSSRGSHASPRAWVDDLVS